MASRKGKEKPTNHADKSKERTIENNKSLSDEFWKKEFKIKESYVVLSQSNETSHKRKQEASEDVLPKKQRFEDGEKLTLCLQCGAHTKGFHSEVYNFSDNHVCGEVIKDKLNVVQNFSKCINLINTSIESTITSKDSKSTSLVKVPPAPPPMPPPMLKPTLPLQMTNSTTPPSHTPPPPTPIANFSMIYPNPSFIAELKSMLKERAKKKMEQNGKENNK